jgi:hypothetical protein
MNQEQIAALGQDEEQEVFRHSKGMFSSLQMLLSLRLAAVDPPRRRCAPLSPRT